MAKRLLIILLLVALSSAGQLVTTASPDTGTADEQAGAAPFEHYQSADPAPVDASAARADFPNLVARDDGRAPQFVFPPDDRQRVSPADPRVAWIVTYYNDMADAFVCSAAFIGPDTLLTAAHCIYDTEEGFGFAEVVDVFPGIDGLGPSGTPYDADAPLPHGWHEASDWFVPTAWIDTGGDFLYDFALISLGTDVGNDTGWMPVGVLSDDSLASSELWATTVGYPSDKPDATQWITSEPGLDYFDVDFFETQLDQFQGQSGSPVFRRADEVIFGVVSFEAANELGEFNVSRRINASVAEFLDSVCNDAGCTYDLYFEGEGRPTGPPPQPGGQGSAFDRVWARTDLPVVQGDVERTWMWGPQPFTEVLQEPYAEAPNGTRDVVYYDKTRMEITSPNADPNSIWYVTNGLLVRELVSGRLQLGHETYEQYQPAQINVAGDADDPTGPTYATFAGLQNAAPLGVGASVTQRVDRAGNVTNDPNLAGQGVTTAHFVPETNHTVAAPFWDFMNSQGTVYENGQMVTADLFINPFYATGFPITEPYWAEVKILGTYRLTLIQVFERRVLTYTPGNPPGFLVEAGNVGQHYYRWRYETIPNGQPPVPQPDPDPTPEPPPPPPADGVPAEGEILSQSDLSGLGPVTGPFGDTGAPTAEGYAITNQEDSFLQLLGDGIYSNASFTVRTRVNDGAPIGLACVIARAQPSPSTPQLNAHAYHFCSVHERPAGGGAANITGAVAFYQNNATVEELGVWELDSPFPASQWHEIKLIARGSSLWFVLNGELLGGVEHGAVADGHPGFSAWNITDTGAAPTAGDGRLGQLLVTLASGHGMQQAGGTSQVEFSELTVRTLQ